MISPARDLLPTASFIYEIPINEVRLSKDERLGSGSFGTVYQGVWRNRNVAVKAFRHQKEITSFKNELKQLSEIRHPNIVRLYGSCQSPNLSEAWLIMELADCPLDDLLHETPVQEYDLRHACNWAHQAAAAMAYCHDLKPKALIHRDIKPANLLLFEGGKVLKICDFGTAVSQRSTMTNNTGTVCYMAPEVFKDVHYDARCDVFSWSIMFWEILARKKPYFDCKDHTLYKLQVDICQQGLRPRALKDCPTLIWQLIERSWDGEPQNRPHMKRVVQEMVKICRIAGIKSHRGSTSSESSYQQDKQTTPRSSVTAMMSQNPAINVLSDSTGEDLLGKKKMYNHIRAMKYRLKLAEDRRKLLEREALSLSTAEPSDQLDELKNLDQIINSMKDSLDRIINKC